MSHFPVSSSILSAHHLGLYLRQTYPLRGPVSCRLLKAGINHTYLVTDEAAQYIYRVYSFNWRTQDEIGEELRFIGLLKDNGLPVSSPLLTVSGSFIQTLEAAEGTRFGVLFTFAPGEKSLHLTPDTHFRIGELMARLHAVSQTVKLERVIYTPRVMLIDSLKQLAQFLPPETEEMGFMASTQRFLLDELARVDPDALRQGALHLDLWPDNLSVDPEGRITFFDFDFCGNGWLAYDIAYYLLQLYFIERDPAARQTAVGRFLDGYESISPIPDEEKRVIPLLRVCLYFFYLGVQCQRHENWANVFINDFYLKRYVNGLIRPMVEQTGSYDYS